MFGTNLTLEDFARTARVVFPGEVRKLADASVDGRPVYVVQTKPAPDAESEYSRIVTSIEQEHCLPLRRESFDPKFEKGERPRKIYSVGPDDVKVSGKYAVAVRAQLDDAKDGSQTRLRGRQVRPAPAGRPCVLHARSAGPRGPIARERG